MVRTGKNGFTLMEMVITLTMLAILAAIAGPYLSNGVRAYNDSSSSVHTLSNLRSASERLVREIREIRRDGLGNYDITSPIQNPSSTLRFFKADAERVTFTDAAPLLMMSYFSVSGETPYTLSDELSSITFRYWQSDGITPANLNTEVAIIEFELIMTHAGNNYPQRSRVALRNQP